jgi:hypothetical protein
MATYWPQKHSSVKEENKRKIAAYLNDPDNEWPHRAGLGVTVCGYIDQRSGNDLTVDPNAPDAILNCVKQRETGVESMFGLFFHPQSCQFLDPFDSPPKQYLVSESSERFKAS